MKTTRHLCLFIFLLAVLHFPAFATWSIIVIDPKTKEIGIAGASCTMSVYGIGAIVPGKGAIVVQAMSNGIARLQGFRMIMDGATPAAILEEIRKPNYNPELQQYAILCMNDIKHPATYTGTEATPHKGTLTGNGISVQGVFVEDPGIINYCRRIIEAIGLHGNIGIQVRYSSAGEPLLVEINPRVQGTIVAALGAGVNLPLLAVKQALDIPFGEEETSVSWGTRFSRYWTEIFY